ncbi:MAG: 50S ribosomal protein L23 [Gemmatimonadales bacterium]|jgi:large subunit ribosomal protein L23
MRDPRQILVRPIITEKTTASQMENNQYAFEVLSDANKLEIKYAVEHLFDVHVKQVRTAHLRGKWRRRGTHVGKRPNWKKALVTLAEGETIEVFEGL